MAWKAPTQEAARRPPSTPGLSRRSGRIPALPYPPIKLLHCTAVAPISPNKNHPLWKKTAINPGGLGGQSPSRNCHQKCAFRPDSAGNIKSRSPSLQLMSARSSDCLERRCSACYIHTPQMRHGYRSARKDRQVGYFRRRLDRHGGTSCGLINQLPTIMGPKRARGRRTLLAFP